MSPSLARLFVILQRLMPKTLLTSLVYRLARVRRVAVKNFLIRRFVAIYKVNTGELVHPVPEGFPTFNDFFTRELASGARPIDMDNDAIICPVDGTVSACGPLDGDQVFQAKGLRYSLTDLLATDTADAAAFAGGSFATIYLAPYNYHRVHAPVAGEIRAVRYIPGTLFSVNEATVSSLPDLFARNERIACHVQTESGPLIIVFVGALNVGTINTRWSGDIRPRRHGVVEDITLPDTGRAFAKGETIGWFNMGSTVILILPPGQADDFASIDSGQTVRMGSVIGRLRDEK